MTITALQSAEPPYIDTLLKFAANQPASARLKWAIMHSCVGFEARFAAKWVSTDRLSGLV